MKTAALTSLALLAFAGNSVLCRLVLGQNLMDAAGFTGVRLISGVLMLMLLMRFSQQPDTGWSLRPDLRGMAGASWLFIYAVCFSYAYLILDTGTGALILFGSVQLTLLFSRVFSGHRPVPAEWLGVLLAFSGLCYLLWPAVGQPGWSGFALMGISGLAWGLYTLAGQGSVHPLADTGKNFFWTLPFCLPLLILANVPLWTPTGVLLAVVSGAVTSGIGYAIWYAALPALTATQAGVLQLLVPVLAAVGGVLFSAETLSLRLLISATAVLGGIAWVIRASSQKQP